MHVALVLALLVLALVLFATEKVSVDVITLLLLTALVVSGILTPAEVFAGFSSDIIVILGSVFVISGALQETGLLDAIGAKLLKVARGSRTHLLFLLMATAALASSFMNNTTVTAMLLSPVIGLANKANVSPSKLLIPLAYASILGGTCTLIGTSTNVAVSGYLAKSHLQPLTLFEITPVGLAIVAVGILYMLLFGWRLLPDHREETRVAAYAMRDYLSEIVVLPNSPLIGQQGSEWELSVLDFQLLRIIRDGDELPSVADAPIQEGDTLLVEGNVENLIKVRKIEGVEIKGRLGLGDPAVQRGESTLAEVLVAPQSDLLGRTLEEVSFRQRFRLNVLAIYRHERPLRERIGGVRLKVGDLLLVEGPKERIDLLRTDPGMAILGEHHRPLQRSKGGLYALGLFVTAIVVSALGLLPLSIAFLGAAVLTVLLGCLSIERAHAFIDLRMLILIGGMTAFGTALEKTGAAELLAHGIATGLAPLGAMAILGGFLIVTILLTQPMSNAAAALTVLPIALSAARQLGASERAFAIGIMLAASVSFIAPLEPACVLVYGPGKYRFRDFVKIGAGLTLALGLVVLCLVPVFWPLHVR